MKHILNQRSEIKKRLDRPSLMVYYTCSGSRVM